MRHINLSRITLAMTATVLICFSGIGIALAGPIDNTPSMWTPELAMKLKNVGTVRVSPDGRRVAYTVAQAVMTPDKSEFVTQIYLANTDGSDSYQITFGEKSSTDPQWSPDGKWLAFTSSRSGKNNLR